MRRVIIILAVVIFTSVYGVSAQSAETRQAFEDGMQASQSRDFEKALAYFERSRTLVEKEDVSSKFSATIHYNIGVCLYQLKQWAKAVGELEKVVSLRGRKYENAYYALGMAHAELRNWSEAERAFLEAVDLNKENGEAWFDLAFVFLALEKPEQAKEAFRKAVKYRSVDSAISHNNIGVILAVNGEFTAAENEFKMAMAESHGALIEAKNNLTVCKHLGRNRLVAKFEFSKSPRSSGE